MEWNMQLLIIMYVLFHIGLRIDKGSQRGALHSGQ